MVTTSSLKPDSELQPDSAGLERASRFLRHGARSLGYA